MGINNGNEIAVSGAEVVTAEEMIERRVADEREFSDSGNAYRFVEMFGGQVRYNKSWGWLTYDGGRWMRVDDESITRLAIECVNQIMREALTDQDTARAAQKRQHALRSFGGFHIREMVRLAAGLVVTPVNKFDAEPNLLNLRNGTYNFATGTLQAHDPADLLTKQAPVDFDVNATAPTFEKFMGDIFGTYIGGEWMPSTDLVQYVLRLFGYAVFGRNREQIFPIAHGEGSNGKSTLFGTVMTLFGDYAQPLKADSIMRQPHGRNSQAADPELAALAGARFVFASEPSENSLDIGRIKELTGGEPMQVRELHKAPFKLEVLFSLFLSTNKEPRLDEYGYAVQRRIIKIPFNRTFTSADKDETMKDRLAREASGILNLIIKGAHDWAANGLGQPAEVTEATAEYMQRDDEYSGFFDGVLVKDDTAPMMRGSVAFEAFKQWADREGVDLFKFGGIQAFYPLAEARGVHSKVLHGARHLRGVRFAEQPEQAKGTRNPFESLAQREASAIVAAAGMDDDDEDIPF